MSMTEDTPRKKRFPKKGQAGRTHGLSESGSYKSWKAMKTRCYNKKYKFYDRHGGRGIRVCDRWRNSFENFYADMGPRPPGMSLDRINNDGHYQPDNCRWASLAQQANNRRGSIHLTYDGKTMTCAQWALELGIIANTFYRRLEKNLPNHLLFAPKQHDWRRNKKG